VINRAFEIEILQHKIEPCIVELVYNCISWWKHEKSPRIER
jgi:hypothetical protein